MKRIEIDNKKLAFQIRSNLVILKQGHFNEHLILVLTV